MTIAEEIAAALVEAGEELGGELTVIIRRVTQSDNPYVTAPSAPQDYTFTALDLGNPKAYAGNSVRENHTLMLAVNSTAPIVGDKLQMASEWDSNAPSFVVTAVREIAPTVDVLYYEVELSA